GRRVVVAIDVDLLQLADRNLGDVGHEVVGDAVGVFANEAGRVRADGVAVAQQRDVELRVGLAAVGQDALGERLGGAVGDGGRPGGEILADGHAGGVTVDGGRGGEDDVVAVVAAHHIQDGQRAVAVVRVVFDRLGDALPHRFVGGELDDAVDVRVGGKDGFDRGRVGHIRLHEAEVPAGDLPHALEGFGAGVVEVVRHDNVVTGIEKFDAGVAADVTGAAADQDGHNERSFTV